jgi:tRNA (mo5U34)-methyltransferase
MATKIPGRPKGFDPASFFGPYVWHQRWQIFEGVFTPGINPIEEMCAGMGLPPDLSGKRVLDIGAWNGCLSYECERRGAAEIVALGPENPEHTGFYKIRDAIGSTRTAYQKGTIYDLDPGKLGYFDVVICAGVLYHLRYPLLGLDNIRRVCTGDAFFETFAMDNDLLVPYKSKLKSESLRSFSEVLASIPLWQFFRRGELCNDDSNWFGPNVIAVKQALQSAGFNVEHATLQGGRACFRARVVQGAPEFLTIGSGEAIYYDTLVRNLLGNLRDDSARTKHERSAA